MENEILEKLSRLEQKIEELRIGQKEVLSFEEFCAYVGISRSHGYKLTSTGMVPCYKPGGKQLFLKRSEVDNWLTQNKVKSVFDINSEAETYIATK